MPTEAVPSQRAEAIVNVKTEDLNLIEPALNEFRPESVSKSGF